MTNKEFRKWRRLREITQQEVASFCNINKSTVCRWEKGETNVNNNILTKMLEFVKSMN